MHIDYNQKAGVLCAAIFSFISSFSLESILNTIVLSAIGAIVGFIVSKAMSHLWRKFFKKKPNEE